MAFIHQLIADIEEGRDASPQLPIGRHMVDLPEEVVRFAPKNIRLQHQTADDRIEQLETEIKHWQDRAARAETRLHSIEQSVQQIAAKYIHAAPRK